jgi:hypothetical protein
MNPDEDHLRWLAVFRDGMAAASCMFFPFGTGWGVFTILVLLRPTVKGMFGMRPAN